MDGEGVDDKEAGRRGIATAMDRRSVIKYGSAFCLLNAGKLKVGSWEREARV